MSVCPLISPWNEFTGSFQGGLRLNDNHVTLAGYMRSIKLIPFVLAIAQAGSLKTRNACAPFKNTVKEFLDLPEQSTLMSTFGNKSTSGKDFQKDALYSSWICTDSGELPEKQKLIIGARIYLGTKFGDYVDKLIAKVFPDLPQVKEWQDFVQLWRDIPDGNRKEEQLPAVRRIFNLANAYSKLYGLRNKN